MNDVPVYVNAKEVVDASGRAEALELNYCTFYAWNGHYSIAGVHVGAHAGAGGLAVPDVCMHALDTPTPASPHTHTPKKREKGKKRIYCHKPGPIGFFPGTLKCTAL